MLRAVEIDDLKEMLAMRERKHHTLRTPYGLNYQQQLDFYNNVICDRNNPMKFFVYDRNIGSSCPGQYPGIYMSLDCSFENGIAEIGYLSNSSGPIIAALSELIYKAFNIMRLKSVYCETYHCNPNIAGWREVLNKLGFVRTTLPMRKFYDGKYWGSDYSTLVNNV